MVRHLLSIYLLYHMLFSSVLLDSFLQREAPTAGLCLGEPLP